MNLKKWTLNITIVSLIALPIGAAWSQNRATVNGVTYECSGSMMVSAQGATCDGRPLAPRGEAPGSPRPCSGQPTHRHRNPDRSIGGWVHDRAQITDSVYISSNSSICNPSAILSDRVQILEQTLIGGTGEIDLRGVTQIRFSNITGSLHSSGVTQIISSTLMGDVRLEDANITASTISGQLKMQSGSRLITSMLSGDVTLPPGSTLSNVMVTGSLHLSSGQQISGGIYN